MKPNAFTGEIKFCSCFSKLKDKSGVKWIWDMFSMITSWNVRLGAKMRL